MPRLKKEYSEADGWTRWVQPLMEGYRMACCDCGLVHDMAFRVYVVTERNADGSAGGELLPPEHFRVQFKARRNERSTAAVRRKKKTLGKEPVEGCSPESARVIRAGSKRFAASLRRLAGK